MKTKNHGIGWLISRAIGLLIISATLVWGTAYFYVPMYSYMDSATRQAAAVVICAFLLCGFGLVWLWAKITDRI